jgi:hypothetical protein
MEFRLQTGDLVPHFELTLGDNREIEWEIITGLLSVLVGRLFEDHGDRPSGADESTNPTSFAVVQVDDDPVELWMMGNAEVGTEKGTNLASVAF